MKKLINAIFLGLLFFSGPSLNVSTVKSETIVICPEGDKYLCYSNKDGLEVRKGKGRSEVIIK
ncbi:hypothetical protein [Mongoliitalea daihaiensis]|uniref:hypothetical protein n=1 Tax=Mongoliitalea daihaiensis TaxID=2782006 RepID=UPI001F226A3A|nr:hypothetical protein [Mongoliitalea daihaiensis]UJP65454.1 hypothetical protein IPZ59_02175 [Mongoliitalea daihaiensis]